MAHPRMQVPTGHGELLTEPAYESWAQMAGRTSELVARWNVEIGGVPVGRVRQETRVEVLSDALSYTREIGVPAKEPGTGLIVATGHQPGLVHPGIWVKDFLLQRLADESGASAIDFVVDTDTFEAVTLAAPCMTPEVRVCNQTLAVGSAERCFARSDSPDEHELYAFRQGVSAALHTLPAPAIVRHFETYCDALERASHRAEDLATALTVARRLYEEPTGTDYLEMPVTRVSRSTGFRRLLAHVMLDARHFAEEHNAVLASYREMHGVRSSAQPFPDLGIETDLVELPVWAVRERRWPVFVRRIGSAVEILVDGEVCVTLPEDHEAATLALASSETLFAPRALMLTFFVRMLVADLFIHGVGGARYDRVTDALATRYFGIELPPFVATSMTMYLPVGVPLVSERDVAEARKALHTLEHNPDSVLADVEFESEAERARALDLAETKRGLVSSIAEPGADKKSLGTRIRQVNEEILELLGPLEQGMRAELERLEGEAERSSVLTDRTYPFCLWSPLEVQDKAT